MIYSLGNSKPQLFGKTNFVASNAIVVGDVSLGENASVWFGAILRGDNDSITIGSRSNIQDGCVVHVDSGHPVVVGNGVTVGHKAVLHGCTIKEGALIGINAVVLNGAIVGRNSLIGANALVTPGTRIPDNSVVMGSPGRVVRDIADTEITANRNAALAYVEKCQLYRSELKTQS